MVHSLSLVKHIYFVKRRIYQRGNIYCCSWSQFIRFIIVDKHKEIHRFDRNTFGWANRHVELADELASSPLFPLSELHAVNPAVIHYTPHYLFAPTVPFEMKRFYPHAKHLKFLVMLRDPVDRAVSSYWFQNSHIFKGVNQGILKWLFHSITSSILKLRIQI